MIAAFPQSGRSGDIARWRSPIDQKLADIVAKKLPMGKGPLLDYYGQGNASTAAMVDAYVRESGKFDHPTEYDVGLKSCADARQATHGLSTLLRQAVIHERTAGSVVRSAHFARHLKPNGLGIIECHRNCGASAAAHEFELIRKTNLDNMAAIPGDILKILMSIPEYVRRIPEPDVRDPENAIAQAFTARRILDLNGHSRSIFPAFFDWTDPTNPYRWVGKIAVDIPAPELQEGFAAPAVRMLRYAFAEGRTFDTQYSTMVVLYDPYRLGRINEPHAIMSALGNELFCVTFNFDPFDPHYLASPHAVQSQNGSGKKYSNGVIIPRLADAGMGSVFYAAYDKTSSGYGHVLGVGGPGGTHFLGILDTSHDVLLGVKEHLLRTYPIIRELTSNGDGIILMHYNRDTAKVTFLDAS